MKKKRRPTIDLAAVRAARKRLEAIAREHPELIGASDEENRARWEAQLPATLGEEDIMAGTTKTRQVAFRLPEDLIARVDAFADQMGREQPGISFTRADAVRVLLTRALGSVAASGEPSTTHAKRSPKPRRSRGRTR